MVSQSSNPLPCILVLYEIPAIIMRVNKINDAVKQLVNIVPDTKEYNFPSDINRTARIPTSTLCNYIGCNVKC